MAEFVRYPETVFLRNGWQILTAEVGLLDLELRLGHRFIRISDDDGDPESYYGCVSVVEGEDVFKVHALWPGATDGHDLTGFAPLPSCVIEMELSPRWEERIRLFASKLEIDEYSLWFPPSALEPGREDDQWTKELQQGMGTDPGELRLETAKVLYRVGRLEESHLILAGVLHARVKGSRSSDLAAAHLGCVLLSRGNRGAAMDVFRAMALEGSGLGELILSSLQGR